MAMTIGRHYLTHSRFVWRGFIWIENCPFTTCIAYNNILYPLTIEMRQEVWLSKTEDKQVQINNLWTEIFSKTSLGLSKELLPVGFLYVTSFKFIDILYIHISLWYHITRYKIYVLFSCNISQYVTYTYCISFSNIMVQKPTIDFM